MPISKRHLDVNTEPASFDVQALGRALEESCPEAKGKLVALGVLEDENPYIDIETGTRVPGARGEVVNREAREYRGSI